MATASEWHVHSPLKFVTVGDVALGMTMILEAVMDRIAQANIVRFNLLLETETDPSKRTMIARLLAEERAKEPPPASAGKGERGIG